ncbi:MAG: HD domain-containing protein, partial [Spirochaetales bacterium]|nr:HD domain-containing protein [Spirochaetales bacterium]
IKMNAIDTSKLEIGTYFTKNVFLDQGFLLLTPEVPVSQELVTRLKKWNFRIIYSEGETTKRPVYKTEKKVIEADLSIERNEEEKNVRTEADKYFTDCVNFFKRVFEKYIKNDDLDRGLIIDKIKEMRQTILNNKDIYLNLSDIPNEKEYIVVDAVKTAIYAVALAELLKFPVHRQIDIGVAGLLHDIGMLKIPRQIYLNDRRLNEQERKIIQAHVNLSAQALRKANFSNDIVQAILEHHENFNGSGYPQGLDGTLLTSYGKIVAVVSAYVAATSSRLHRDKMQGHSGVIDILKQTNKKYDPQITKALILMLSIYPLGTFVELENGQKGIVCKTSIYNPKNPIVKLLLDANNEPFTVHKEVMTIKEGSTIKRALTESEILNVKNVYKFTNYLQNPEILTKG